MTKKRNTKDDIGFDEKGEPFVLGAEAGANSDAVVEHPDAKPILIAAMVGNRIGIRVYGEPTLELADLLDHLAVTYRKATTAALRSKPQ